MTAALAHANDPVASHEAAANLDRARDGRVMDAIRLMLAEEPRAAFQLKRVYANCWQSNGWPHLLDLHSVARRLSELVTAGDVVPLLDGNGDTVHVLNEATNRRVTVWCLAEVQVAA